MTSLNIHYALQTCDVKSYQGQKRFASDDRTEISKKCIKSFLESIKDCIEANEHVYHNVAIFQDNISQQLKTFILDCQEYFSNDNLQIEVFTLRDKTGIRASIEECYLWLQKHGKDLVYQVQDDYLFSKTTIRDMLDIFYQIYYDTKHHPIISPYNDFYNWITQYKNVATPRTIFVGKKDYWIQFYDCSCSFLTTHEQFSKHWDLYNTFFYLIDKRIIDKDKIVLENMSLNYMFTQRSVLGVIPIKSLAFHLQSDFEKDPHIDYRPLWDSIDIEKF